MEVVNLAEIFLLTKVFQYSHVLTDVGEIISVTELVATAASMDHVSSARMC